MTGRRAILCARATGSGAAGPGGAGQPHQAGRSERQEENLGRGAESLSLALARFAVGGRKAHANPLRPIGSHTPPLHRLRSGRRRWHHHSGRVLPHAAVADAHAGLEHHVVGIGAHVAELAVEPGRLRRRRHEEMVEARAHGGILGGPDGFGGELAERRVQRRPSARQRYRRCAHAAPSRRRPRRGPRARRRNSGRWR